MRAGVLRDTEIAIWSFAFHVGRRGLSVRVGVRVRVRVRVRRRGLPPAVSLSQEPWRRIELHSSGAT